MKTEQEQIEQIEKVLKDSVADYKHLKKKGVCYCYAETLIEHGYGDISEYKAEIERLRTTLGQCSTELNSALESLKSQCREIGELKAGTKQAKIDVLNKAKEKFNAISRELGDDCDLCGVSAVCSCRCEINELIKEIENGEDKG